jgi:glucose-1-phosphate thymidylyltransferase
MNRRPIIGIVLAAGRGSRMKGVAPAFSKTLLPVSGIPIVAYAARSLMPFVDKVLLVTNPSTSEAVLTAVRNSIPADCAKLDSVIQPKPLGVAHAIGNAIELLATDSTIVVVCGDNIIIEDRNIMTILDCVRGDSGDCPEINLAWTYREFDAPLAKQFAVFNPEIPEYGALIEKPENPQSKICWCGPIAFRSSDDVKRRISNLTPSARGEYEATELMNSYITNGEACRFLLSGLWFDVGNEQSLKNARNIVTQHFKNFK